MNQMVDLILANGAKRDQILPCNRASNDITCIRTCMCVCGPYMSMIQLTVQDQLNYCILTDPINTHTHTHTHTHA